MTSTIKVNNIQNQCGANIINENSDTITIGASGDTIALASGASQTGFGRTGTVDWQTGSIKTTDFTAVDGQGFFVDTNGGEVTATLPTGSAGSIVSIQDYRNTFDTANCIVQTAGSQKINGGTASGKVTLSTEGEGITLVYIDSTVGWRSIQDNDFASSSIVPTFMAATGGTITCSGNCKIHTFTGPGTFCVSALSNVAANNEVSYVVVAGGGGGGGVTNHGGGGGAGGYRETKSPVTPYTASPLDGQPSAPNRVTVTATSFPITVGSGGARIVSGSASTFSTITSAGGGAGGNRPNCSGGTYDGVAGGSGGGGTYNSSGGAGNTPPTSPSQGFPGGTSSTGPGQYGAGGGGGALVAGAAGSPSAGGPGGNGTTSSITGSAVARAGGGGGSSYQGGGPNAGGTGGGGAGTIGGPSPNQANAVAGTANTGGGGGGGERCVPVAGGFAGGSGVVIIRYKFQ